MCECGCVSNWSRYTLPAPNKAIYLVSLVGPCVNCTGESQVRIELLKPGTYDYQYYRDADHFDGPLPMENGMCTISTGLLKHQFVDAMLPHLVGIDSKMFDEDTEAIDEIGAEVIAEEMYESSCVSPYVVAPQPAKAMANLP